MMTDFVGLHFWALTLFLNFWSFLVEIPEHNFEESEYIFGELGYIFEKPGYIFGRLAVTHILKFSSFLG